MTGQFDQSGDLWIEVDRSTLPENTAGLHLRSEAIFNPGASAGFAVTKLNLTAYMRSFTQPSWLNAALSSQTAQITIVGNTPTTGG